MQEATARYMATVLNSCLQSHKTALLPCQQRAVFVTMQCEGSGGVSGHLVMWARNQPQEEWSPGGFEALC